MKNFLRILTMTLIASALFQGWAQESPQLQTMYRVKYVAEGTVYLIGGRSAGLTEGMKLIVKRTGSIVPSSGSGEMSATYIVAELTVD